jgi:hypothetical protein
MTAREGEQRPVKPVYLSGVLTAGAELSAGHLYDGSAHADNASPAVAPVSTGGAAMLVTEDDSGQLTRLRIPGPWFLRLTDDAAGKLARSRQQPRLSPPIRPRRSTAMAVLESPDYRPPASGSRATGHRHDGGPGGDRAAGRAGRAGRRGRNAPLAPDDPGQPRLRRRRGAQRRQPRMPRSGRVGSDVHRLADTGLHHIGAQH